MHVVASVVASPAVVQIFLLTNRPTRRIVAHMPQTTRRDSIETTGLRVVRYTTGLTPQGRAADAAGFPTCAADEGPIEQAFTIKEGRTVASVVAELLAAAQDLGHVSGVTVPMYVVAKLLRDFAYKVEAIEETAGELLARTGLEEGERIEVRFATAAEQRAELAAVLARCDARTADRSLHQPLKNDGSTRCTVCGGFTTHFEGCGADVLPGPYAEWPDVDLRGRIAYLEGLAASDEDALNASGYRELQALEAERDRRSVAGSLPLEA